MIRSTRNRSAKTGGATIAALLLLASCSKKPPEPTSTTPAEGGVGAPVASLAPTEVGDGSSEDDDDVAVPRPPLSPDVATLLADLDTSSPVHIGRTPVQVGRLRTIHIVLHSVTRVHPERAVAGTGARTELSQDTAWKETVRASTGAAATALEVSYLTARMKTETDGRPQFAPAPPTVGNTYRVSRRDKDLAVTDAKGKPVSDAAAAQVKADFDSLGQPEPFWATFPGDFVVGQPSEAVEHALRAMLERGLGEQMQLTELTAVCRGRRDGGATAVFELDLSFSSTQGDARTDGRLLGAVLVDTKRGDVERIVAGGLLRGRATSAQVNTTGANATGTMHWEWTATRPDTVAQAHGP